jgi:hypothetical protein
MLVSGQAMLDRVKVYQQPRNGIGIGRMYFVDRCTLAGSRGLR